MFRTHTANGCITAPALAISSTASMVSWGSIFKFRAAGRISATIAAASMSTTAQGLAKAALVAPYPSGTASVAGALKTNYYRIYTLVGTLPTATTAASTLATATPTFSWLASADYDATADIVNLDNAPLPDASNQAAIGFVIIQNMSGSDFTPGTTALTAVTTTYVDNIYAQIGA